MTVQQKDKNLQMLYAIGLDHATWLLKPGTFGPSNQMVDIQSNFTMHCMVPDRWRASETHWFIYFTLTSIYCQLYPNISASNTSCSEPYGVDRFSASYANYMMVLHVQTARINDTGVYTCSRPAYFAHRRPAGVAAYVGIIRKFLHSLFPPTKSSAASLRLYVKNTHLCSVKIAFNIVCRLNVCNIHVESKSRQRYAYLPHLIG